MKWRPAQAKAGDLIRVPLGSIFHYGIFASEKEVLQFGLPPLPENLARQETVTVCATDIDEFACGRTVEVAVPSFSERLRRFGAQKTVRRARARLGEGGYDLLHNNCEHFVYECAYGVRYCAQEQEARKRWCSRPILDVYLAPLPQEEPSGAVLPKLRERYIRAAREPSLRTQRRFAWELLKTAITRSFGLNFSDLRFRCDRHGKWSCDRVQFSIAYTDAYAVIAVSNAPVGVDAENITSFTERIRTDPAFSERCRALRTEELPEAPAPKELARALTRCVSLYKCVGTGRKKPDAGSEPPIKTGVLRQPPLYLSVCGERADYMHIYLVRDGAVRLLPRDAWRNEVAAL